MHSSTGPTTTDQNSLHHQLATIIVEQHHRTAIGQSDDWKTKVNK